MSTKDNKTVAVESFWKHTTPVPRLPSVPQPHFVSITSNSRPQEDEPANFLLCDVINLPVPEPDWIFEDLWEARTKALFTGDGGVGKLTLSFN